MIRLIACDLDGTLMGEGQRITPAVRAAVAEAQAAGVQVTVATGRMFAATVPFARELGITAPLICYQGGWIQAPDDPQPRFRRTLPRPIAGRVLEASARLGWHTVLYADGRIFLRELQESPAFYDALLGEDWAIVEGWETVLRRHQVDKVLFVAEAEAIPAMEAQLRRWVGEAATVVRSHARFVEVVPAGVDKGRGLAWLAASLNIPREAVMAIGDRENDLPMLRWAGLGVAMGNAPAQVKAAADWIAPPVEADGAAVAIRRVLQEGEDVRADTSLP